MNGGEGSVVVRGGVLGEALVSLDDIDRTTGLADLPGWSPVAAPLTPPCPPCPPSTAVPIWWWVFGVTVIGALVVAALTGNLMFGVSGLGVWASSVCIRLLHDWNEEL